MARALAATLTVGVMMGVMGGCADGPSGDQVPDDAATEVDVAVAVRATEAVESARVELATAYHNLGGGVAGSPAGAGDEGPVPAPRVVQRAAFDRRSGRGEAEMDMSELAAVLDDTDEAVPGDFTQPSRVVVAGDTVYSQLGPLAAEVGLDPATWVTRELSSLADRPIDNDAMALLVQPLGMLDLLKLPVLSTRATGDADAVRGVRAVRLRVTVDLRPRATNGHAADESIEAKLRSLGLTELPVDLWLAADGTVRRLSFAIGPGSSGGGGLTTTFELYDVDEPIDVDVPSGPDVIDQAELRARIER
jgi:hypothetical protein